MPDSASNLRNTSRSLAAYEHSHRHPANRTLHAIGIPLIALSGCAAVSPWRPFGWSRTLMLGTFLSGWALLFVGHAIEGNRPAVLSSVAAIPAALQWWMRSMPRLLRRS
jgi:uncharacterized membrane protein YGL010W